MIGTGEAGGKAGGQALARALLEARPLSDSRSFSVSVPSCTVVGTEVFEEFIEANGLRPIALSGEADARIAEAFLKARLPDAVAGALRSEAVRARRPLVVRASSLLEGNLREPFAGVHATVFVANVEPDSKERSRSLAEAAAFVYASTFFGRAAAHLRALGRGVSEERIALLVQEVEGERHGHRFYPAVSGLARSFDPYPHGHARPEDGVVHLKLGLATATRDAGACWSYCPAYPRARPPFGSTGELLDRTQTRFSAVDLRPERAAAPFSEARSIIEAGLAEAEADGVLGPIVSSYDAASDRVSPGLSGEGPRMLTFAPLVSGVESPVNDLLRELLEAARERAGCDVEVSFTIEPGRVPGAPARVAVLGVRPLLGPAARVSLPPERLHAQGALVASRDVRGNGIIEGAHDVVAIRRDRFDSARTRAMAREVASLNRRLTAEGRPYVLVGFGRWGSSDPWLGIPVSWSDVSGACAFVEASLPEFPVDPSRGAHFFQEIASRRVPFFTVGDAAGDRVCWDVLEAAAPVFETDHARVVRFEVPLCVIADGRRGTGLIVPSAFPAPA